MATLMVTGRSTVKQGTTAPEESNKRKNKMPGHRLANDKALMWYQFSKPSLKMFLEVGFRLHEVADLSSLESRTDS